MPAIFRPWQSRFQGSSKTSSLSWLRSRFATEDRARGSSRSCIRLWRSWWERGRNQPADQSGDRPTRWSSRGNLRHSSGFATVPIGPCRRRSDPRRPPCSRTGEAHMKFVLVNGRTPRPQSFCALCCEPISDSYLREIATRLSYCDHRCYVGHSKVAVSPLIFHARAS